MLMVSGGVLDFFTTGIIKLQNHPSGKTIDGDSVVGIIVCNDH